MNVRISAHRRVAGDEDPAQLFGIDAVARTGGQEGAGADPDIDIQRGQVEPVDGLIQRTQYAHSYMPPIGPPPAMAMPMRDWRGADGWQVAGSMRHLAGSDEGPILTEPPPSTSSIPLWHVRHATDP